VGDLVNLVRLARPLFLLGGVILQGLGVAIALYGGATFDLSAFLWGQIAITSIQLMTHFNNDYFDLAADRANLTPTRWSGGSRVLAEGRLPARVGLVTAVILALIALIATLILGFFIQPAPATIPLLLLSLFLAWEYSAPPLRLHSRGLGEVTVALTVPTLVPLVGFYLQTGELALLPLLASFPLACLQAAMIHVINFPDAAGDAAVGKRTWVVRFGPARGVSIYLILLALAYGSLPLLVWLGLPGVVATAVLLPLPLALWLAWQMVQTRKTHQTNWNNLGFWSVGLLMGTAMLETLAFFWLAFGWS
jgi:1,4-dihydroxy-2-naphthoate octaprenyltransferase